MSRDKARKAAEKLIKTAERYADLRVRNAAYVTRNGMIGPTAIEKETKAQDDYENAKAALLAILSE